MMLNRVIFPQRNLLLWVLITCAPFVCRAQSIDGIAAKFVREIKTLGLSERNFDYKQELNQLPDQRLLHRKQALINRYRQQLAAEKPMLRSLQERILYDQLVYALQQQQRQLTIELALRQHPARLGALIRKGLARQVLGQAWYALCIQRFTNTDMSSDELMIFGQQQVKRAQRHIERLRVRMGYATNKPGFYRYLASAHFFVSDTQCIIDRYRQKERIVRYKLDKLVHDTTVRSLGIHQWHPANSTMPPAIYLPDRSTFAFNFSGGRYNRRAMDWVFLHEGIPGHHYQLSRIQSAPSPNPFLGYEYYFGTIEGWGCYVESLGKQLGLYATLEEELGRWEWDLVRSVRVVLDVGIHARGWTYQQALAYWKANITGQDAIAQREIIRVTNWPGQCLSYKVGSMAIEMMKAKIRRLPRFNIQRFHEAFLSFSSAPLNVVAKHIVARYKGSD